MLTLRKLPKNINFKYRRSEEKIKTLWQADKDFINLKQQTIDLATYVRPWRRLLGSSTHRARERRGRNNEQGKNHQCGWSWSGWSCKVYCRRQREARRHATHHEITTSMVPWLKTTTGNTSSKLTSIQRHYRTHTTCWRDRTSTRSQDKHIHPRLECHSTLWEKKMGKLSPTMKQNVHHAADVVATITECQMLCY